MTAAMEPADYKLLVVDDNEENRDILSRRLERKGFSVRSAAGGREALDLIARERVDLVLLDVMMPDMSGLEVLQVLRKSPLTADLPVIMATAKTESHDVVEALELGASDYVTKPLDFPVVLARVHAQLRARRGPGGAPAAPARPEEIKPGLLLADRYRLESEIGKGSFGTVFRAVHLDLDHPVAVKVLQTTITSAGEALARFRREGISACRVKHPNAVTVMDFGVTPGGVAYLVMELLEGESLFDEVERTGVLTAARTAAIAIPVCGALEEAHGAGVIHRDIKPSNIFIERTPRGEVPKLLDFGIAKILDKVGTDITSAGSVLGTLAYMAPERFNTKPIDGKADVYSLGITLYQLLCGRTPFVGREGDPMGLVMRHVNEPPAPLREMNPDVPEAVEAAVMQALRKKPMQRPSAAELAANLARAVGHAPPEVGMSRAAAPDVDLDAATRVAAKPRRTDPDTDPDEIPALEAGTAAFEPPPESKDES